MNKAEIEPASREILKAYNELQRMVNEFSMTVKTK
jgi:hypothetical protein